MKIKKVYSSDGKLDSIYINRGSIGDMVWASLPFDATTKIFNPQTEIDHQLLAEARSLPEWETLDLSDRPPEPTPPQPPDWVGLERSFRGTPIFGRIYLASKSSLAINAIFTLLSNAITSTHSLADLEFALLDLQASLIPGLSLEEVQFINSKLVENNFVIQLSISNRESTDE